jgi:hypothetical protein
MSAETGAGQPKTNLFPNKIEDIFWCYVGCFLEKHFITTLSPEEIERLKKHYDGPLESWRTSARAGRFAEHSLPQPCGSDATLIIRQPEPISTEPTDNRPCWPGTIEITGAAALSGALIWES